MSIGLDAREVADEPPGPAVVELAQAIADDGGVALAQYREPVGGHWVILASLPIDKVTPTPFQRELSDTHAKRLQAVITKVDRFLDPLVTIRQGQGYWSPNGMHRLEAMNRLGAKAVIALVVPEPDIAFQILALNTEKAHNLKDKSLEVVRMADALANDPASGSENESTWAFEFEEPAYLTIGRCYQQKSRFSGSAYMPVVRRCEEFLDQAITDTIELRKARADKLLELDKRVNECVAALKEAGHDNAYLKPFVVARINPLRFSKTAKGSIKPFDETVDKMLEKANAFDAAKVQAQDVAQAG